MKCYTGSLGVADSVACLHLRGKMNVGTLLRPIDLGREGGGTLNNRIQMSSSTKSERVIACSIS